MGLSRSQDLFETTILAQHRKVLIEFLDNYHYEENSKKLKIDLQKLKRMHEKLFTEKMIRKASQVRPILERFYRFSNLEKTHNFQKLVNYSNVKFIKCKLQILTSFFIRLFYRI